jgi:protein-disulfide isomerase
MSPKSSSKSKSRSRKGSSSGSSNVGLWIIGISVGLVVLVIGILAFTSNRKPSIAIAAPDLPAEWLDGKSMGNPDAAVVIQAWEDFVCPSCREWTTSVEPKLIEDYVKTGLVRLEFHQFPLQMHAPGASMAANASECAADQGGFWPYHDRLFQVQPAGQSAYTLERLVEYADGLGMSGDELMQCMTAQTHAADVLDSYNQAVSMGLGGTPSIILNGQLVQDAYDYRALKANIDSLLEASQGSSD